MRPVKVVLIDCGVVLHNSNVDTLYSVIQNGNSLYWGVVVLLHINVVALECGSTVILSSCCVIVYSLCFLGSFRGYIRDRGQLCEEQ